MLRQFFMVDWENNIRPLPRYWELLHRRGRDLRAVDLPRAARAFTDQEITDLQVLFNLAWVGFGGLADDEGLRALRDKGRDFDQADVRYLLLAQQRAPRGGGAALAGALGARPGRAQPRRPTTTPSSRWSATPTRPTGRSPGSSSRRASPAPRTPRWHVRRAMESHAERFGAPPAGMWPAEGSVSPEALEVLASEGVKLGRLRRGRAAPLAAARGLARSRRSTAPGGSRPATGGEINMLFRDRSLSDLIGFNYARAVAGEAVADFLDRLAAMRDAWRRDGQAGQATVGVFLDGENAWEHYVGSGKEFLDTFYAGLERVRPGHHLHHERGGGRGPRAGRAAHPLGELDRGLLPHLDRPPRGPPGLDRARQGARRGGRRRAERRRSIRTGWSGPGATATPPRAPTGSGGTATTSPPSSSPSSTPSSAATWCRRRCWPAPPPPPEALAPIKQIEAVSLAAEARPLREPTLLLTPVLDGRETTFFEWQGSGLYRPGQARGSMYGGSSVFQALRFGFDLQALHLCLEPAESALRSVEVGNHLRVELVARGRQLEVDFELRGRRRAPRGALRRQGRRAGRPSSTCWSSPSPSPPSAWRRTTRSSLAVHVMKSMVEVERLPRYGFVNVQVPGQDFEGVHWRV